MPVEHGPRATEIDFAIITAVEVERKAVCRAFGLTSKDMIGIGSRVYWRRSLTLKSGDAYEIVVTQAQDMANVESALVTSDVIHDWSPGALLLVGIAGSANREAALGDIILGRDVYYYQRGKETTKGLKPEPIMYRADATLWSRVIALPMTAAPLISRPDGQKVRPSIHQGVIASGERVIANEAIRDVIAAQNRKILAIEMEGYGFSVAVWQSLNRCRHLVIRAICDRADKKKNQDWQPYAAKVAAGFTKYFLLRQPLPPRSTKARNEKTVQSGAKDKTNRPQRTTSMATLESVGIQTPTLSLDVHGIAHKLREVELEIQSIDVSNSRQLQTMIAALNKLSSLSHRLKSSQCDLSLSTQEAILDTEKGLQAAKDGFIRASDRPQGSLDELGNQLGALQISIRQLRLALLKDNS